MQKTVHDFAYAHRHQIASKVDLATDCGIGEGYLNLSPDCWSLRRIALNVEHQFHKIEWVALARVCADGKQRKPIRIESQGGTGWDVSMLRAGHRLPRLPCKKIPGGNGAIEAYRGNVRSRDCHL